MIFYQGFALTGTCGHLHKTWDEAEPCALQMEGAIVRFDVQGGPPSAAPLAKPATLKSTGQIDPLAETKRVFICPNCHNPFQVER